MNKLEMNIFPQDLFKGGLYPQWSISVGIEEHDSKSFIGDRSAPYLSWSRLQSKKKLFSNISKDLLVIFYEKSTAAKNIN